VLSLFGITGYWSLILPSYTLSRVGWYAWREWRVLVRMIGFINTLVTTSRNHIKYSAIADFTHTAPLLVPQLKRRNYNSLTESLTLSITHEWSLLITHQIFTRWNFLGHLPPRTQDSELCHYLGSSKSQNQSHIVTDGQSVSQSVSKSRCRALSRAHDQIFIIIWQ
jgi:hypothetical protein